MTGTYKLRARRFGLLCRQSTRHPLVAARPPSCLRESAARASLVCVGPVGREAAQERLLTVKRGKDCSMHQGDHT